MREIKFRGIGLDRKWYYGDLRHNGSSLRIEWEETDWKAMPPLGTIVKKGVNVKRETVGQYTGLKDRNGKEVYEGDIIRSYNDFGEAFGRLSVVKYNKTTARYTGFDTEYGDYEEIIGNIHDNPELIEIEAS